MIGAKLYAILLFYLSLQIYNVFILKQENHKICKKKIKINPIEFVKLETLELRKDTTVIIMEKYFIGLYFNFYCSIKVTFTKILLPFKQK